MGSSMLVDTHLPLLSAISLQYILPHLTRVQPECSTETGTSAFSAAHQRVGGGTSTQQGTAVRTRAQERDIGDRVFKHHPELYAFHGSALGSFVCLLALLPPRRHAGQPEGLPFPGVTGTAARCCLDVISQAGGKDAGNQLRDPQCSPWLLPRPSHITALKGRLRGTLRMLDQNH